MIYTIIILYIPQSNVMLILNTNIETIYCLRMFDSQNNNRGGYNVGSLYYYQGTKLSIEW